MTDKTKQFFILYNVIIIKPDTEIVSIDNRPYTVLQMKGWVVSLKLSQSSIITLYNHDF